MSYVRNRFYDPATGQSYDWHINHSDEDQHGKQRNIEHTGITGGFTGGSIGLVRQQGAASPTLLSYSGTIFHAAQYAAMWDYFQRCESRSIHFRDFEGHEYEVQIVAFEPKRQRTLKNPRDSSIPLHYWTYSIRMEVLRVISGPLTGLVA